MPSRVADAWKALTRRGPSAPAGGPRAPMRPGPAAPLSNGVQWLLPGSGLQPPVPGANADYPRLAGRLDSNSVVAVCLAWCRDNLPQARLTVGKVDKANRWIEDNRAELGTFLRARPNDRYSWRQTLGALSDAFKIDGNAYLAKGRDAHGVVRSVTYLPNAWLRLDLDELGAVSKYVYTPGRLAQSGIGGIEYDPADVVHFRDGIDPACPAMGLSRLKRVLRAIVGVNAGETYTAAILRNYGVPSYVLMPHESDGMLAAGSPDEAAMLAEKARLEDASRGDNAGGVHASNMSMEMVRTGLGPEELALDRVLDRPEAVIAAILGVPGLVTGLASSDASRTYSNIDSAAKIAWTNGLIPMMDTFAETIRDELGPDFDLAEGAEVRWDRSAVEALQEQAAERTTRAVGAFSANLIPRGVACEVGGFPKPDDEAKALEYAGDAAQAAGLDEDGNPIDPAAAGPDPAEAETPDDSADAEDPDADLDAPEGEDDDEPSAGPDDLTAEALGLSPEDFALLEDEDFEELAGMGRKPAAKSLEADDDDEAAVKRLSGARPKAARPLPGQQPLPGHDAPAAVQAPHPTAAGKHPSSAAARAKFDEKEHPRAQGGRFGSKPGKDAHVRLGKRAKAAERAHERLKEAGASGAEYDKALGRSIRLKQEAHAARQAHALKLVEKRKKRNAARDELHAHRAKAAEQEAQAAARPAADEADRERGAAERAALPERADGPPPEKDRNAGFLGEVPTAEVHFDPHRFQYKIAQTDSATGSVGSLAGVRKWDPELAGVVSVWKDPADGKTYVVNGHNRMDLAKKLGVDNVAVRYLHADDAKAARAKGALANIAEGRGTSIDAAKFFRDTGITDKAELQARGIPLTEGKTNEGLALAGLSKPLFTRVAIDGTMPIEKGAIIGAGRLTDSQQEKLAELYDKQRGRVTSAELKEWVEESKAAGTSGRRGDQMGMFGDDGGADEESLFLHRTSLVANAKERLSREQRLFGTVARGRNAAALEAAGNTIDAEASGQISRDAAEALQVFQALKRTSVFSGATNAAAAEMAEARNDRERARVRDAYYEEVKRRVRDAYNLGR